MMISFSMSIILVRFLLYQQIRFQIQRSQRAKRPICKTRYTNNLMGKVTTQINKVEHSNKCAHII